MTTQNADDGLAIAAYTALKAEQSSRISVRDNYALAYAASLATLFFGYYSTKNALILLAVPPVGFIGFHAYATNDERISAIRTFLRDSLPPSMARAWETTHHQPDMTASIRGLLRLVASLLLFGRPAIASTIIVFSQSSSGASIASATITGSSIILMLVTYIVLYRTPAYPSRLQGATMDITQRRPLIYTAHSKLS